MLNRLAVCARSTTALVSSSINSNSSIRRTSVFRLLSPPRLVTAVESKRSVWSTGQEPTPASHPLHSLTPTEIQAVSTAVKNHLSSSSSSNVRFVAVSLREPTPLAGSWNSAPRQAEVVVLNSQTGIATELTVSLSSSNDASVVESVELPRGVQPLLTPEDCDLAEEISKSSSTLQQVLLERYGIQDIQQEIAADPWSVHLANDEDRSLTEGPDPSAPPRRLVQTFLYRRANGRDLECNHYAHPIDIVPVVDLNSQTLVHIDGLDRPPPEIPNLSVNYHRNLLHTNSYLQTQWRQDRLKDLSITQPEGPSFTVEDGNLVKWQNWTLRVGFNYREGLVLHDVMFDGRPVLRKGSLVEMAVPYADPNPPFQRKCAFDVGDYGLGFCANSLELGCDCLGHIHYFDGYLNDIEGQPKRIPKAICMHEEDDGILWKHVEYRNGHNEARRSRELVLSSIATVVNYEYLFYWRLKLDGTIDFEIRLSGELSTNLPSQGEDPTNPDWGTIVAPGVNAQVHQHMFCARLDMAVDGPLNTVSEIDVVPLPYDKTTNPYGNSFGPVETVLKTEQEAVRTHDATKARAWKIANAEGKVNEVSGKPVAYKLIPFTRGPAQPPLLTHPDQCAVSHKGEFAKAHLWVTQYDEKERYPAGEYTPQAKEPDGLPQWIKANRNIEGEDVVLWHSFGVTHVPRVEDFPVMPCESTGFTLKPDGFSLGNPAIDMPPESDSASKLDAGCCETSS